MVTAEKRHRNSRSLTAIASLLGFRYSTLYAGLGSMKWNALQCLCTVEVCGYTGSSEATARKHSSEVSRKHSSGGPAGTATGAVRKCSRVPADSSIGSSTTPVRISGPFTSIITATFRPTRLDASLIRLVMSKAHSLDPCAMFNRKTSTPRLISCSMHRSDCVAGPSVAMIFVSR